MSVDAVSLLLRRGCVLVLIHMHAGWWRLPRDDMCIHLCLAAIAFVCMHAGWWRLPRDDMATVITIVRRLARLQWALLLNFEEGFDCVMQV